MNLDSFKAYAAEHPDAVAAYVEQGKNAGHAKGRQEILDLLKSNAEAAAGNHELAISATLAGHDTETVALAVATAKKAEDKAKADADAHAEALAAKDKEIERLKFEASERKPVGGVAPAEPAVEAVAAEIDAEQDPEKRAALEWKADKTLAVNFLNEAAYVAFRKADLGGQISYHKPAAK